MWRPSRDGYGIDLAVAPSGYGRSGG
jgi:hypothetical protein